MSATAGVKKNPLAHRMLFGARFAWWLGLLVLAPGLLLANPFLIALAGILLPGGFVLEDMSRAGSGGVSAMTAYSATAAVTSFANIAALIAANTPERSTYYLYVSEPYVYVAMCLWLAAAVVPPLVFRFLSVNQTALALEDMVPKVRGEIADRQLVPVGVTVGLSAVLFHWFFPSGALGTLIGIVFLAPLFTVFVLARAGTERNVRGAMAGALTVAVAESVRALLFGYLRGDVAAPFVAFTLGALTGARSLRPLKSRIFLPVYGALALFVLYFAAFGTVRSQSGVGLARLQAVQEFQRQTNGASQTENQTVLSRLSTINQLSQVGRLAQEGGYLRGQTLSYLAYAFIPRFLWPQKPAIAKGSWFALQIGLAYVRPDGLVSNSINMTIPGELYLNYGWAGVFVGLTFLGLFIATCWRTTEFWSNPRNVLGTAFSFCIMWPWIGFSLGADLQILVTLVAIYLLLLVAGWTFPVGRRASGSGHEPRAAALTR